MAVLQDKLGICQWFHYQDYATVDRTVELLQDLGIRHLRTGISWADYLRPEGKTWYDWQMKRLQDFDVLLSVWHTPPSLSEGNCCSSPPRRLQDYADFLDLIIGDYGDLFSHLELWNEPNNRYKWNFEKYDPQWAKFGEMIGMAAHWTQHCGKPTVLGGMIPVDPHWLNLMGDYGVLQLIDIVAIHEFPEMWWDNAPNWSWYQHWQGWDAKIATIEPHCDGRPIWVTETGLATWDLPRKRVGRFELQIDRLEHALRAPAERVYWYSLIDLDPEREAIEGFHVDENEYHMGLVRHDGSRKPAYDHLKELLKQSRSKSTAGKRRPQHRTVDCG